ncbi:hypothetical protein [Halovenus marina]|uniref:hypothetical protein n=1 Tax=Halovenus marina TaxID=3396621 RepID=UPI003F54DA67
MGDSERSRRTVLQTGLSAVGVAAAGSLSGCVGLLDDGDDGGGGGSRVSLSQIPAGTELLIDVDIEAVLADDTLIDGINESIQGQPFDMEPVDALLDGFKERSELDLSAATSLLVFRGESLSGDGAILWADWDRELVFAQARRQLSGELTEGTYRDRPTLASTTTIVVELEDGVFAVTSPSVGETLVDLREGDAEAVSDDLREVFENQDSYGRFAYALPGDEVATASVSPDEAVEVASVGGSLSATGDDGTLTTEVVAASPEDATTLEAQIDRFVSQLEAAAQSDRGRIDVSTENVTTLSNGLTYETDGSTLSVEVQMPTEQMAELGSNLLVGPFFFELGDSSARTHPTAQFEVEYESTDDDRGRLTITHVAGESIQASNLLIRGSGFADVGDVDQTGSGSWQGTTDDNGRVTAGHRVVLGVTSDYSISVVWWGDGETVTLTEADGPDA